MFGVLTLVASVLMAAGVDIRLGSPVAAAVLAVVAALLFGLQYLTGLSTRSRPRVTSASSRWLPLAWFAFTAFVLVVLWATGWWIAATIAGAVQLLLGAVFGYASPVENADQPS